MRVLILGAGGMLGHKLALTLEKDIYIKTYACVHNPSMVGFFRPFSISTIMTDKLTARNSDVWLGVNVVRYAPDVVINCIGVTKHQKNYATSDMIFINSMFPHQLSEICEEIEARLIHISTDCVFSGEPNPLGYLNNYNENDSPCPSDEYGRSKLLGEPIDDFGILTIRTSFVGRELTSTRGLLEWLLSNRNKKVQCYNNTFFSGMTTNELSRIIKNIIVNQSNLCSMYHIAGETVNKCNLLYKLNDRLSLNVEIDPETEHEIDRSLDGFSYLRSFGATYVKSWEDQIEELKEDILKYDEWRKELK